MSRVLSGRIAAIDVHTKRALSLLGLALALTGSASADQTLLGLCSEPGATQCASQTAWTLQETAAPAQLDNPSNAPAGFEIVVTEGPTSRKLSLADSLTLDGLLQSGTNISAIFLSLEKSSGSGGYSTIASAVIGDPSNACGCPYVQSSMTLTAQDSSGHALSATPLLSLAYGDEELVSLSATWNIAGGLVNPGDTLRLQPCIAYSQAAISLPPGCYATGGSVHAVKACSPVALDTCTQQPATLTETLSSLSNSVATLGSFTAETSSTSLSPPQLTQTPGGPAISFTATPTGVPGTQSTVSVQGPITCKGVGTSTFNDTASIAGSSASAAINIDCTSPGWSCASLGPATPYNVFLTQGISASYSDIEGALAAEGNVTLSNYAVGASLSGADSLALIAGGNLSISSGWIFGNAWVGGTTNLTSTGLSGVLNTGVPIDFASASTYLSSLSSQLAALSSRGTVTVTGGAGAVLSGADPVLDVFNVSAATLESTWGVSLSVPLSAFVVVNVSGTAVELNSQAFSTGGLSAQQLVINLPQATALTLNAIGLEGTLLAPLSAVQFNDGVVAGAIIASSFTGDGQMNLVPQVSCIPLPASNGGGSGGGNGGASGGGSGGGSSGSSGGSGGGSGGGGTIGTCSLTGAANPYSIFVSGNYTGASSDVQGAIAAGGNVTLSSYTVGALLSAQTISPALVAGENLTFTTGGNVDGAVDYGGSANIASQVTISGPLQKSTPINFAAAFASLSALSQQLAAMPVNGASAVVYGEVILTGTDNSLNVFTIPATTLNGQWGVSINVPEGSYAVVNLTGATAALQHTIALNGLQAQNLLFNFPQASSISIQDTELTASVLAPSAAINFNSGVAQGSLIGASFNGGGQTNLPLLNPCIPSSE